MRDGPEPAGDARGEERAESSGRGVWSRAYGRRLVIIVGCALAVGLSARWAAKPAGFGRVGYYRADAPAEEARRDPRHQGKLVCAPCHEAEFQKHEKDVHLTVECEDCHGVGAAHVAARKARAPAAQGRMFRQLEQANCLACHRRLTARPALFPTVDVGAHFKLVGVRDPATTCQSCHSPHEPLFLDRKVTQARIHPLIHPCTDCHRDASVAQRPRPEGHVVTFQCQDCHADVVADFAKKPHHALDCRACHSFRKDSEFSGRIFKNANPQFCLLCHLDAPFKEKGGKPPLIKSFEEHRKEMGGEEAAAAGRRCVDCHLTDKIHAVRAGAANVVVPGGGAK